MTLTAPRDHLVRALEADLIGPFRRGLGPDGIDSSEDLTLPPSRWYLTGFLAPEAGREEVEDANEELAVGSDVTEEETGEVPADPKKRNFLPASLGLTVFVPAGVKTLEATLRYADYVRPELNAPEDPTVVSGKKPKIEHFWRRVPVPAVTEAIALDDPDLANDGIAAGASGLRFTAHVEVVRDVPGVSDGTQAVSIFVVNRRATREPGFRDAAYVFQVELELHCASGFFGRPDRSREGADDLDEETGDLQYRDVCEYGVGHGVSTKVVGSGVPVTRVRTTWLPEYEVRRVVAREAEGVTVAMETLAQLASEADVRQHLERLPKAYAEWIAEQRQIAVGDGDRKRAQKALLDRAEIACQRIAAGVEQLAVREDVRDAFCLANKAMAMAARKKRPSSDPEWRLFQLAFVLLNLPGLADPTHPDRETAELIFFPTGGGKTEAYLGVIATTLLLRRLRAQGTAHRGLGVAVILRYTLRLLTLDQLARAASLVCALEILRQDDTRRLGPERFSVGLWVGRSATANTMAEVQKLVTQYQAKTGGNPAPIVSCPWCNSELTSNSLSLRTDGKLMSKNPEEVHVACMNDACEFCAARNPDGIPVLFVDEQVYRELPSFLIGTVDKFAMIPWRGETGKLFGKVNGRIGRKFYNPTDGKNLPKGATPLPEGAPPPELIVQDELHLISGPLGTMVGLYETAIDFLCRTEVNGKPVRPKVIAATATVRRASEQIQALFGRRGTDVRVFPPPSVNAMDTYFSLVDNHSPGRLYVGVAAQGRSMKAILLRTYRALLAAGLYAHVNPDIDAPEKTKDAYTTLAGYFNSLRELGGMRRIAEDELLVRASKAEEFQPLDFVGPHPWFRNRRLGGEPVELTSRESTVKIKQAKDALHQPRGSDGHVDVLLASNMISVGVDIDRLGLMVVAGQPKTTAEYIQASSRVGRQADRPGLVVTCMNLHKPRDRSHYERFCHYHQSFYRYVEATSVTPFSGPALDRGLAGAFVAMARFVTDALTPADGVMHVAEHKAALEPVLEALAKRAASQPGLNRKQEEELHKQVAQRARNLVETWENIVRSSEDEPVKRRYSKFDRDKVGGEPLLHQALDENAPERNSPAGRFCAPTSMRDVEQTAHLWLTKGLGPFESGQKREEG